MAYWKYYSSSERHELQQDSGTLIGTWKKIQKIPPSAQPHEPFLILCTYALVDDFILLVLELKLPLSKDRQEQKRTTRW